MTVRDWILVGWGVLAAGLYVWLYRQVKRGDDAIEANEALRGEMERFNATHKVIPLPPADVDATYEAFMLDESTHPHPPKAA